MSIEKRKSVRVPVDFPASFAHERRNHPGRILNLSSDGALLQAEELIEPGQELQLSFEIPDQEIRVRGKVMWGQSVKGNINAYGMGIFFQDLADAHHTALELYIRTLLDT